MFSQFAKNKILREKLYICLFVQISFTLLNIRKILKFSDLNIRKILKFSDFITRIILKFSDLNIRKILKFSDFNIRKILKFCRIYHWNSNENFQNFMKIK